MAINPSIALGVRPMEIANPLAQYAQISQIQGAQQANRLGQMQMAEYERTRQEEEGLRNYLAGADLTATETRNALLSKYGKSGREFAKGLTELDKARTEEAARKAKLAIDKTSMYRDAVANIATPADAIEFMKLQATDPDMAGTPITRMPLMKVLSSIPQDPVAFENWKKQTALGMTKYVEQNKPQLSTKDIGGSIVDRAFEPLTGKVTTLSTTAKTPTFADITSQGQLKVAQGQLAVSQGQLKVAQDRLAKDGAALDPSENAAISKAILEGRLDPNKVNGRNAKILATTLLANPDANVLELGVSAAGATAAERSLATQTAKMSTAANEASKMVNVVRDYSNKVDRTEFPTINSIQNAVDKGTGGKEIVQLNTSINALVNSYARAISPTGQPTVSDKNHAREVINSAYSSGQINAILDVMQQEMDIARQAAGTASTELKTSRETARGRGPAATQGTGGFKYIGKEGE